MAKTATGALGADKPSFLKGLKDKFGSGKKADAAKDDPLAGLDLGGDDKADKKKNPITPDFLKKALAAAPAGAAPAAALPKANQPAANPAIPAAAAGINAMGQPVNAQGVPMLFPHGAPGMMQQAPGMMPYQMVPGYPMMMPQMQPTIAAPLPGTSNTLIDARLFPAGVQTYLHRDPVQKDVNDFQSFDAADTGNVIKSDPNSTESQKVNITSSKEGTVEIPIPRGLPVNPNTLNLRISDNFNTADGKPDYVFLTIERKLPNGTSVEDELAIPQDVYKRAIIRAPGAPDVSLNELVDTIVNQGIIQSNKLMSHGNIPASHFLTRFDPLTTKKVETGSARAKLSTKPNVEAVYIESDTTIADFLKNPKNKTFLQDVNEADIKDLETKGEQKIAILEVEKGHTIKAASGASAAEDYKVIVNEKTQQTVFLHKGIPLDHGIEEALKQVPAKDIVCPESGKEKELHYERNPQLEVTNTQTGAISNYFIHEDTVALVAARDPNGKLLKLTPVKEYVENNPQSEGFNTYSLGQIANLMKKFNARVYPNQHSDKVNIDYLAEGAKEAA